MKNEFPTVKNDLVFNETNIITLYDDKQSATASITYNQKNNEISIQLKKPLNVKIDGDITIDANSEIDITTRKDMKIDTFLSKLYINSYLSNAIKDLPESIEKREKIRKRIEDYEKWLVDNKDKVLEHAEQFFENIIKKVE